MEGYRAEMRGLKLGEERNRVVLKMDSAASVSMSGKKEGFIMKRKLVTC